MQNAKASQERSQREEDLSLQRAQNKARDILNLSHSDLEDIMSADGESVSGVRVGCRRLIWVGWGVLFNSDDRVMMRTRR